MTDFVERALKTVAPAEYTSRAVSHQLELVQGLGLLGNEQIAVFICTTAFPCVACPLFVYEPRYRLMVRRCVESGMRQFGIAACLNKEATGTKRYVDPALRRVDNDNVNETSVNQIIINRDSNCGLRFNFCGIIFT